MAHPTAPCLTVHVIVLLLLVFAAVRGQDPPSEDTDLIEAKDQEIRALKAQLEAKQTEITKSRQCRNDIVVKDKKISGLEARINGLEDQVAKTQSAADDVVAKDAKISTLEAQIVGLKDQLAKLQSATEGQLSACQQDLDAAKRGNEKTQREFGELEHAKKELSSELTKAHAELSDIHTKKEALSTELSEAQVQLAEMHTAEAEGQDNLKACKGELKKLADGMLEAENQAAIERIHFLKLQQDLRAAILPYWLSEAIDKAMDLMSPYMDITTSHPVFGEFISGMLKYSSLAATWIKETGSTVAKKLLEAYVAAKPVMEEASRQAVKFLVAAKEWLFNSYIAAKPHIEAAAVSMQEYASMAMGAMVGSAKQGWTLLLAKFDEIMASEAVAQIKLQGSVTATELRQYIASYMRAYPALQAYATPQTVDIVLYSLLSLPGLVVLCLLSLCCSSSGKRSKRNGTSQGGAGDSGEDKPPNETAKGQRKARRHKGRTITEGTDSVRVPS